MGEARTLNLGGGGQMGVFERKCEGRKSERKVGKWGRAAGFHAHGQCMKINSVCVPYTALSPSTLQASPVMV